MSIDRRRTFDAVVDHDDAIRPNYPAALFDELFAMMPDDPTVIEVGPGTGQATRDLLARGARVHAIELGPALAKRLRTNLPSDLLEITVGEFEAVDLPSGEADAVFAATAHHWISRPANVDRPADLLRPGGVMAIVDLVQVNDPADHGFFAAAQPIYDRYGQGTPTGYHAPTRDSVDPPIAAQTAAEWRFRDVSVRRYDWDQTDTTAQYRTLMRSYSATQAMEPGERVRMLDDIQHLVDSDFGGRVTRPLVVALTTARRR